MIGKRPDLNVIINDIENVCEIEQLHLDNSSVICCDKEFLQCRQGDSALFYPLLVAFYA